MAQALRNILVVAVIAALVVIVPGGGTTASVAVQAVSLTFLAAVVWVAMLMYRERRLSLYALGDKRRAIAYCGLGVLTLTLTATARLWHTVGGKVAWFVLLVGAVYAMASVVLSARRY